MTTAHLVVRENLLNKYAPSLKKYKKKEYGVINTDWVYMPENTNEIIGLVETSRNEVVVVKISIEDFKNSVELVTKT